MLRSAVSKVMWVGRATVFLVGLAVILAMVAGVASNALAANGQNLIIGNGLSDTLNNVATLPTKLRMRGTADGPALQVTQQSTGAAASGVGVTVPSGKAPITVNSAAGKATNLNADRLDGQSANAFLGASGKASDADLLDGRDSSGFVPTTTYTKNQSFVTNGNGSITGNGPACDQGDVLLGGGIKLNDAANQEIVQSRPDPGTPNSWFGSVKDDSSGQGAGFEITLLCGDLGTPHTG